MALSGVDGYPVHSKVYVMQKFYQELKQVDSDYCTKLLGMPGIEVAETINESAKEYSFSRQEFLLTLKKSVEDFWACVSPAHKDFSIKFEKITALMAKYYVRIFDEHPLYRALLRVWHVTNAICGLQTGDVPLKIRAHFMLALKNLKERGKLSKGVLTDIPINHKQGCPYEPPFKSIIGQLSDLNPSTIKKITALFMERMCLNPDPEISAVAGALGPAGAGGLASPVAAPDRSSTAFAFVTGIELVERPSLKPGL